MCSVGDQSESNTSNKWYADTTRISKKEMGCFEPAMSSNSEGVTEQNTKE